MRRKVRHTRLSNLGLGTLVTLELVQYTFGAEPDQIRISIGFARWDEHAWPRSALSADIFNGLLSAGHATWLNLAWAEATAFVVLPGVQALMITGLRWPGLHLNWCGDLSGGP